MDNRGYLGTIHADNHLVLSSQPRFMNLFRVLLFLGFSLVIVSSSSAQDDGWWKKLFKKETTEPTESSDPDTTKETEGTVLPNSDSESKTIETTDTSEVVFVAPTVGRIVVSTPLGLDRLDSLYRAEPPVLKGYRIQIYFGDLSSAREKRLNFISANEALPCYLVQNAPNFAVLIGDFRTHLDAYRELQAIKPDYPLATIVPAKIEPPTID